MTKDHAQKQAIRARMAKTGERYTTARHYLLDLHHPEPSNADIALSPSGDEEPDSNAAPPSPEEGAADSTPRTREASPAAAETAPPPRVAEPGVSDAAI